MSLKGKKSVYTGPKCILPERAHVITTAKQTIGIRKGMVRKFVYILGRKLHDDVVLRCSIVYPFLVSGYLA